VEPLRGAAKFTTGLVVHNVLPEAYVLFRDREVAGSRVTMPVGCKQTNTAHDFASKLYRVERKIMRCWLLAADPLLRIKT
jgi:hypothetical protein